ncbi:phage portal protein [Bacillus pseudomycoides]|uniref:phage portal protein n=1 Tax=Bacillus TaxID=1386 RepID=UPI0022491D26|nr:MULTISPECIES: phage portal protein [Bacillus]MCX2828366.1 phage portal protein [Bacillus sp. DHT2]MDR4915046.1 phage portal protein [Bacillus pseudomycoides]
MAKFWFGKPSNEDTFTAASVFVSRPIPVIKEQDALKIPTVKSAVELISNSIAQLPIYLYEEDETDNSIEKLSDKRIHTLNCEANNNDTAQVLKKKIVADYLLYGTAYLYKDELGKLHHLKTRDIQEEEFTEDGITIAKTEYVYNGPIKTVTLEADEVIVIDSGTNGLLVDSGQMFSVALEQLNYQNALMQNSATPVGILKATSRLTEPAINRLRSAWQSLYSGTKNAGRTVILEEGMSFEKLSMNPQELMLNESNKHLVSEIARVFSIPESMLNSAANKYASNEANSIQFLQGTLAPILTSIESAFDKKLLTQSEKDSGCYFRFDTSEILRSTEAEKIKAVSEGLKSGIFSFNQAAHKLDLPKVEKDYHLLSIGHVMKYEDGSLEYLNLGEQSKEGGKSSNEDGTKNDEPRAIEI